MYYLVPTTTLHIRYKIHVTRYYQTLITCSSSNSSVRHTAHTFSVDYRPRLYRTIYSFTLSMCKKLNKVSPFALFIHSYFSPFFHAVAVDCSWRPWTDVALLSEWKKNHRLARGHLPPHRFTLRESCRLENLLKNESGWWHKLDFSFFSLSIRDVRRTSFALSERPRNNIYM